MPAKRYIVSLTPDERQTLEELTKKGKAAAAKINHARILLKAEVAPVVGKLFRLVGATEQQRPSGAVLQYVAEKVDRCPASRSFHCSGILYSKS
jgi:hypothetical protein